MNWPHHLTITVAGKKHEEYRLGRYEINPRFGDDTFAPLHVR